MIREFKKELCIIVTTYHELEEILSTLEYFGYDYLASGIGQERIKQAREAMFTFFKKNGAVEVNTVGPNNNCIVPRYISICNGKKNSNMYTAEDFLEKFTKESFLAEYEGREITKYAKKDCKPQNCCNRCCGCKCNKY